MHSKIVLVLHKRTLLDLVFRICAVSEAAFLKRPVPLIEDIVVQLDDVRREVDVREVIVEQSQHLVLRHAFRRLRLLCVMRARDLLATKIGGTFHLNF